MKVLTIALILFSVVVNAQYNNRLGNKINNPQDNSNWTKPKLYIPATILVATFSINQFADLTIQQRNTIAITGCLTSAMTYIVLSNPKYRKGYLAYKYRHTVRNLTFWK